MVEVEANYLLVMADVDDQGERLNYYNLPLQLDSCHLLTLELDDRSSHQQRQPLGWVERTGRRIGVPNSGHPQRAR